jgi:ABC-type antimicrobial peptide transport system permease subunit
MGIRMALGSTMRQAMTQVAAPGLRLALYGALLGCVLALWAARVLEHFLWQVSTHDPTTQLAATGGLMLVAAAASLLPALRLARLDPAQTLRHE